MTFKKSPSGKSGSQFTIKEQGSGIPMEAVDKEDFLKKLCDGWK